MKIIGIDPGVSGAIAILDEGARLIEVFDMPVMPATKKRQQVNGAEVARLLRNEFARAENFEVVAAILENVHTMPQQGVASSGAFMEGVGVIKGVLAALGIPYELISPGVWKRRAGLIGKNKDASRTLAQQLYPQVPLGRKKDVGRAEAILIARYGGEPCQR